MLRPAHAGATTEAEARAYLQSRLRVLLKYLFVAYVVLLGFLEVLYRTYPAIEPVHDAWVFALSGASLAVVAIMWRVLLVRGERSHAQLRVLDTTFTIGTGIVFGAAAMIAYDFRPSGYVCLMYTCFTLLSRALVVPSTGRRTAIVSILGFAPMGIAAVYLAAYTEQEVGGPALVTGFLVVAVVTVLLAWAGSQIIYEMRSEVRAAQHLGQYKLIRRVDQGGLGEVYLANHLTLRRPTAIKLIRPERVSADTLARFEREVFHTSQLTHPNTVAVFDYGRSADGVFYYAMEYLGGGINLEQLVRDHGPQPAGRVIAILAQVCGALQEAHDSGIIHRDIKPANIMLCQRGGIPDVAKVVDFGLAEKIAAGSGAAQLVGTPAYLAPEAIREPGAAAPSIDLYALGCVGYFLLTGRRVFDGKTPEQLCKQHVEDTPEPLGDKVPEGLAHAIKRCLAKQPADRHASAAELAATLGAIEASDWGEADALAWWRSFSPAEHGPAGSISTLTIPIDLDRRRESAA
jgi:eukaryotic-like serine/threonine-protein kinase